MTQFNFEKKQAKKLKKLRRKIALNVLHGLLTADKDHLFIHGYFNRSTNESIGIMQDAIEKSFSVADKFIMYESNISNDELKIKEATQ